MIILSVPHPCYWLAGKRYLMELKEFPVIPHWWDCWFAFWHNSIRSFVLLWMDRLCRQYVTDIECVPSFIVIVCTKANIANTLWAKRTAFTRLAITPTKVIDLDEIWNIVSEMLGLALADFGRDLRRSDNLKGSRNFEVNNARFPVRQILRHFNITTSIGKAVKTFGTEFWKFYCKGSLFQQKLLRKFPS